MFTTEWISAPNIVTGDVVKFREDIRGRHDDGYGVKKLGERISVAKVLHEYYESSEHLFSILILSSKGPEAFKEGVALTIPGYIIYGTHEKKSERLLWLDEAKRRIISRSKAIRRTQSKIGSHKTPIGITSKQ